MDQRSILIIEPDSVLATQYARYFISHGYAVKTVGTAQAAILAADKQRPDLVIVEPLLAAHSGIEFLYEFRSYVEWLHIPVIICSRAREEALGMTPDIRKQCGIAAVLYKPELRLASLGKEAARALAG